MNIAARPIVQAFIGLGANLGEAEQTLKHAAEGLGQLPGSRLVALSSLYRSAPLGPAGQSDYLNAVACLETTLAPHALLAALQTLETALGRVRGVRWGPRTLDLDLLLYGNDIIHTAQLVVPHPELKNRNFVVIPLLELESGLRLPDAVLLASLAAAHDQSGLAIMARRWAN